MAPVGRQRGVTLHDVARAAMVSTRTVSRVVNAEGGFSDDTRLHVEAVIERLGYRPNLLARALITRRSGTIGLVAGDITDPFFAELADGVQRAAREIGRTMYFASSDNELARQGEIFESMWSHAVDGVIVFTAGGSRDQAIDYASRGLPIVVVDQELESPGIGSICSDITGGAVLATNHLLLSGRTNIAMIANMFSAGSAILPRRERGFLEALFAVGRGADAKIAHDAPTIEGGRRAVAALLEQQPDIDGVFAYNDLMAIGALQALAASGRSVPDDVALVGFDDIAMCAALVPSLTTVRIDRPRLAREAVAFVQRLNDRPGEVHPAIRLGVELVVRNSA